MGDSSPEPAMAMDDSAPSSPEPAGAQSAPLSPAGSQASEMAEEVNTLEDVPDVVEDEGEGDDLLQNIEK